MRDRKSDTAHREAAERKLGRPLAKGEVVHHENEDKADNSPANLSPKQRGEHTSEHNKNRGLSKLQASLRMQRAGERKLY